MSDEKKRKRAGGKHLAKKSSGLGSFLKPKKKKPTGIIIQERPVEEYLEPELEEYPEPELEKYPEPELEDYTEPVTELEEAELPQEPELNEQTEQAEQHEQPELLTPETETSTLDDDFPMAEEEELPAEPPKPAEKAEKPEKHKKESKPLLERTWVKVIITIVTAAAVFGILLFVSNRMSPREDYAELPAESASPSPVSTAQEPTPTPSPIPSPTPTPTPAPSETPEPSPTPTDSSYLTPETLATPATAPETKGCEQMLLLDSTGSTGSLMYYEKDADGWHLLMTCGATLGKNGVSNNKKEGDNTTPSGEYPLLFVYGETKPISQLPFQKLSSDSVWVDDSRSKYYNTLQSTGNPDRDWTSSEAVYDRYFKGGTHKACIYVGYNGDGLTPGTATAGKGSMITICGKTDSLSPTAGCIDIFNTDMTKLLQYLDPNRNPVIIID